MPLPHGLLQALLPAERNHSVQAELDSIQVGAACL
jgi:hypothetical protein